MKILSAEFFNHPTLGVAKELLGKFLVRKIGKRKIVGMITEVEAYVGQNDKASHASRGKTERTKVMFGEPGRWYVYLVYGMHYCLNIVTEKEDYPAAVLIRGVSIKSSTPDSKGRTFVCISGPGRICKYFKIDKRLNNKPANRKIGLWIEDRADPGAKRFRGTTINSRKILRGKRIGVEYAGRWKNKLWRYHI